MGALQLGEAGVPHDDASYVGEVSDSVFSLDYYRTKAVEFQSVLNALDGGYRAALSMLQNPELSPDLRNDLQARVDDFETKKWAFRTTAEAINLGAAALNSVGGRFPSLSVPGTLGLLPAALPFAAVAAFGTAATLIMWGREWIAGLNDRLKTAQLLEAQASPELQSDLARTIALTESAARVASDSPFGAIAPLIKWGSVAVVGYLVWRLYKRHGSRSNAS